MSTPRLERRARSLSGIPRSVDRSRPWWQRLLRSPWLWGTIAVLLAAAGGLLHMYINEHTPREVRPGLTIPGISGDTFKKATNSAWPTALFWVVLFIWFDRFRKNRVAAWVMAFAWGAGVSTWISIHLNTWASSLLIAAGGGNHPAGAVFIAPFVEEAAKASILFLIAILIRYRLVSVMQTVTLGGLSAAGFAFVENILYYARQWEYSTLTQQVGDPDANYRELVLLRGVFTCFGHPFFTSMTAIGVVIGLRARSKMVRILAPLTGFAFAAIGHMLFNGTASTLQEGDKFRTWITALVPVIMLVIWLVIQLIREQGRIKARLADLVSFGWLHPDDATTYSSLWRRFTLLIYACSQPRRLPATIRMMNQMTELAYLRDAMVLGVVDEIGYERARELLDATRRERSRALWRVEDERFVWPPVQQWYQQLAGRRGPALAGPAFPPPGAVNYPPPNFPPPNFPPPGAQWGPPRR